MRAIFPVLGLLAACAAKQQDDGGFTTRGGTSGDGVAPQAGKGGGAGAATTTLDPGGSSAAGQAGHASGAGGASSASQGGTLISAGNAAVAGTTSALAGAGGQGLATGGSGACTPANSLVGAPIFDAEGLNSDGNDYVQMTASGFFLYNDDDHLGTITPPKLTPGLGVVAGNGGMVFRSTGSALAMDFWGAGIGLWLAPCIDVRSITGVSFWLKTDRPVRVDLSSPVTTPVTGGGLCTADCVPNSAAVPTTPSGSVVELPFSAFVGGSAPADPARVNGVVFSMLAPGGVAWSYALELDDLGVY